jgi:hypothetical protein
MVVLLSDMYKMDRGKRLLLTRPEQCSAVRRRAEYNTRGDRDVNRGVRSRKVKCSSVNLQFVGVGTWDRKGVRK